MQFKFKKISQKGAIAITALLLTILLGAQHAGQGQHQSTDQPDVLAMVSGASDHHSNGKRKADAVASPSVQFAHNLTAAPAVFITENLTADMTWSSGAVYYIMNPVHVTGGTTLRIETGAIIKLGSSGSIIIDSNAHLTISGTANSPVLFTAENNNREGGIVIQRGAQATVASVYFDGVAYPLSSSGQLAVQSATITNAVRAITINAGQATLDAVMIRDVTDGMLITDGTVTYGGSMASVAHLFVAACAWGHDCMVQVPNFAGINDLSEKVCGQVIVQSLAASNQNMFSSPNCDGTPRPSEQLLAAAQHFSAQAAIVSADCDNGKEDACTALRTANSCFYDVVGGSTAQHYITLPDVSGALTAEQWSSALLNVLADYTLQGYKLSSMQFSNNLQLSLGTLSTVATGYMTCAP